MVFGVFRWVIDWDHPGPAVPDGGAYSIRPYPDGRLFSSEWVGAYCIRPTRRPRQGDECGFWVVSQGHVLESPGPYRARLWGVCCCAPTLTVDCFHSNGEGRNSIRPIRRSRKGDGGEGGVWMSRPFLGLRRGRKGRDGFVFGTAEGWGLPIRQVF